MPRVYKSPITSRVFELVADILLRKRNSPMLDPYTKADLDAVLDDLVEGFGDKFADSNPRFDRERFYKACGLGE